jgi:chorismate synthase
MKNTFGSNITLTLFGESHGEAIGAVLDGLPAGVAVNREKIAEFLSKRRPSSLADTARREKDEFHIVSGVFEGKTTGTPICILIPNTDTKSGDYEYGKARPSHADYAAFCKYHGCEDYRGGGHFSGRITAALVAAGGILIPMLEKKGISIGTHMRSCAGIYDREFEDVAKDIAYLNGSEYPVLDGERGEQMNRAILEAKEQLDSVGGVTETAVYGMPAGIGEPWFDSVEGLLSHALFSLGGVKGIEFGMGFAMAESKGSICNDAFLIEDGNVLTKTNHSGGINGGITNGMPIVFRCAVKPTPSIAREQQTVDFINKQNTSLCIKGRHDPAIVRRICPVIDSVTALVLCDLLAQRYGSEVFWKEEQI